jgi:hypothetical protein
VIRSRALNIVLWLGVALVGLIAAIAVIGARLPVDHLAASRAHYEADIDAVWSAVEAEIAEQDMELEIVERVAPHRLVTRIPPGGPFGGTWTCELASKKNGTTLTITERGEVYNAVFRFVSRFVFGHHATLDQFLRAVGTRLNERSPVAERLPAPS